MHKNIILKYLAKYLINRLQSYVKDDSKPWQSYAVWSHGRIHVEDNKIVHTREIIS